MVMTHANREAFISAESLGSITTSSKKPRSYAVDRSCKDCGISLSRYNRTDTCWDHTPFDKRVPGVRGKRRDAGVSKK